MGCEKAKSCNYIWRHRIIVRLVWVCFAFKVIEMTAVLRSNWLVYLCRPIRQLRTSFFDVQQRERVWSSDWLIHSRRPLKPPIALLFRLNVKQIRTKSTVLCTTHYLLWLKIVTKVTKIGGIGLVNPLNAIGDKYTHVSEVFALNRFYRLHSGLCLSIEHSFIYIM